MVRLLDKVGVLANTLGVLKRHGINIEEISNTVFDGALATCTKLRTSGRPSEACLKEIAAFGGNVENLVPDSDDRPRSPHGEPSGPRSNIGDRLAMLDFQNVHHPVDLQRFSSARRIENRQVSRIRLTGLALP